MKLPTWGVTSDFKIIENSPIFELVYKISFCEAAARGLRRSWNKRSSSWSHSKIFKQNFRASGRQRNHVKVFKRKTVGGEVSITKRRWTIWSRLRNWREKETSFLQGRVDDVLIARELEYPPFSSIRFLLL